MTGDPEWPSRYFAMKLLVHDEDTRSRRAVWDAFGDAHPLVRRVAATELSTEERPRLYEALRELYLNDTVHEVRQAAWRRIQRQLQDLHHLDPGALGETQALHVLELLDLDSKQDEAFAMRYLGSKDQELRHAAASFLSRSGALRRLCLEVSLGDREQLERNLALLLKASEVNVTSFLAAVRDSQNPATLLICARVLAENGGRDSIHVVARRVFGQFDGQVEMEELYQTTLEAVARRGGEESLSLLLRELARWRNDRPRMEALLAILPERGDFLFRDWLLEFFRDPAFPAREALRRTLTRMCRPEVLEQVLTILRAEREAYAHSVRIEAVKLLGELELPYCLQILLENLPTLPPQEAREFAGVLGRYPSGLLRERIEALLASPDARIRAALITALPGIEDRELGRAVRRALGDADPDVRIAAVWALVEYRDTRSLNQAAELLRDPVERVRHEVGRALGAFGSEEALEALRKVLADENEVPAVKQACIAGLGASPMPQAVDILVERLDKSKGLGEAMVQALADGADRKKITRLLESLKDASSSVRERICEAFVLMRENGEQAVADLVREDIPTLRSHLHAVLEKTGYVEERIRQLAHRDPRVRQEAAEFLSLVGTKAAFRGIVLAARDPDQEVRVRVVKALERLETPEGQQILKSLENDPDRRVRRYTLWALERLRAKAL
jgi:HEAT repeat protein